MNDQERITDLILTEKKMTGNYDTFASECVNVKLRDDFLRILHEEHMIQSDLFQKAQSKGWYQVEHTCVQAGENAGRRILYEEIHAV